MAEIFETAMLVCFGLSWPISLIKKWRAKTAKGTSLSFLLLILTGYICGIAAKFISGRINYVLAVYFINLVFVSLNIVVYFINTANDRKSQSK